MADHPRKVALLGCGSIGISFAALHLQHTSAQLAVYDPRPDLQAHLADILPVYLPGVAVQDLLTSGRLRLASSVADACIDADLVQEQGPENVGFKQETLAIVADAAPAHAHLWSATSGIPVSAQVASFDEGHSVRRRVLVVHPFNPPHILPLIELSPGPDTDPAEVSYARGFFDSISTGHRVVVVRKEVPGFVGNRLAFALLREAVSLVNDGVVDVADVDTVVEASLGPRWAVQGPFKSYAMGGGTAGLGGFLNNLGESIQTVWDSQSSAKTDILVGRDTIAKGKQATWVDAVVAATDSAYGKPTPAAIKERDAALRRVIEARKSQE